MISLCLLLCCGISPLKAAKAQQPAVSGTPATVDSDADGLSDALEQRLLQQFLPEFRVAANDCAGEPVRFEPGLRVPTPLAQDAAVIYGQATPRPGADGSQMVELRYFHLWSRDCGRHGHPLDTEHVAALVRPTSADGKTATWRAVYWYAGAHESTVCDVSQLAQAHTVHAESHGPRVWISEGKHASYLNEALCRRGCGADRCEAGEPLNVAEIINLGEPGHPANGSAFITSERWPLGAKMSETNFGSGAIGRLRALPAGDIGWANPGRHPAQGIIAISGHTEAHLGDAADDTAASLNDAGSGTGSALGVAADHTGAALETGTRHTWHALGSAVRHTRRALGVKDADAAPASNAAQPQ